jgi:putative ABC transport system permease protein
MMRDDRPVEPAVGPLPRRGLPQVAESRGLAFTEAVRTTLAEVWGHRLRSFLTLIGVILGTGAVVVNITVIEGIKVMIWDGIKGLGFDGVMFVSGRPPEDPVERKKVGLSRGLTQRDVGVLNAGGERLEAVAALRMMDTVVRAEGEDRRVRVFGITPSYGVVHGRDVSAGRWLDEGDQLEARRVAVLGIDLAETFFGNQNPIGRMIRVEETQFRVIGVEGRLGNQFANSGWSRREMNGVLIPLNTFRAYLRGGEQVSILTVKTGDLENLELVKSEIERLVRRSHKGVGDFEVENVADEMLRAEKEIRVIIRNWTIVLGSIAGISLLVGGIGIYSVLKISLVERLYEIGLRKSMGASEKAILVQFLVESTTLSILGGLLGCVFGAVICQLASGAFEAGLPLAPLGLALGIGFAVAVGLFAGIFPALYASRLTPVECLTA